MTGADGGGADASDSGVAGGLVSRRRSAAIAATDAASTPADAEPLGCIAAIAAA